MLNKPVSMKTIPIAFKNFSFILLYVTQTRVQFSDAMVCPPKRQRERFESSGYHSGERQLHDNKDYEEARQKQHT